ncbi:MAG: hypothetical protein ACRCXT_12405 [Paraclostridium sp.]
METNKLIKLLQEMELNKIEFNQMVVCSSQLFTYLIQQETK